MPELPVWDSAILREQLQLQHVLSADERTILLRLFQVDEEAIHLALTLKGLANYAASWGDDAAVWLVLAVLRLIREVSADYPQVQFGCVPPAQFLIQTHEEYAQEIAHRCLTAYQELYDILLRTHHKASSPIWHRRAVVKHFPELIVEIDNPEGLIFDADLSDD
ncbi:MAG: hypothetical protein CUN55_03655 [Phototrophicales bacterium]|nr:MAG: hypothetical protein CUN55_03655 [Phototrophicales bacterium]